MRLPCPKHTPQVHKHTEAHYSMSRTQLMFRNEAGHGSCRSKQGKWLTSLDLGDPNQKKQVTHPGRLTWNIIMEVWKIIFLSKWVICRFHVNLPGRICFATSFHHSTFPSEKKTTTRQSKRIPRNYDPDW